MGESRECLGSSRRNVYPFVAYGVVGLTWAGIVNLLLYRSLNITSCWCDGAPMSLWAEWAIGAGNALPLFLLCYLALGIYILISKRSPCWWLLMASLFLVGTPVSISFGHWLAGILMRENRGGMPWQIMVPPALGFLISVLVVLALEYLISYRGGKNNRPPNDKSAL